MSKNDILNNPLIKAVGRLQETRLAAFGSVVEVLMASKTWSEMTHQERRLCIRHIVAQVESKDELISQLRAQLGIKEAHVSWSMPNPNDQASLEARALVKAMGGPISKNGALVMVDTIEDLFDGMN